MPKYSHIKILVVDDEPFMREAIAYDFQREGFTIIEAGNGDEGFQLAKEHRPNLVLSDMRMPIRNGMGLLELLRKEDPSIPVLIFITGFSDLTEQECLDKGALAVFPKPYDRKALKATVYEALKLDATEKSA